MSRQDKIHVLKARKRSSSPTSNWLYNLLTNYFPSLSLHFPVYKRKALELLQVLLTVGWLHPWPTAPPVDGPDGPVSALRLREGHPEKPLSRIPREYTSKCPHSNWLIKTQYTPMSMVHVDVMFYIFCITCFTALYGASALFLLSGV